MLTQRRLSHRHSRRAVALGALAGARLQAVAGNADRRRWNGLIDRCDYLGDTPPVESQLRYLGETNERGIGDRIHQIALTRKAIFVDPLVSYPP